ncbi:MAG: hypothetical protein AAGD32_05965 [Planctomycetota bacterium]
MDDVFYQSWSNTNNLHPVGAAVTLVLATLLVLVPRRWMFAPLFAACLIPAGQRIVVGGFDFDVLRIMLAVGWARAMWTPGIVLRLGRLDLAFIAWCLVSLIAAAYSDRPGGVVRQLGSAYDALGSYFLLRMILPDRKALLTAGIALAVLALPTVVAMLIENRNGMNPFAFLGGVPQYTPWRDGRLRAQGPFSHPILAGCFWAAALGVIVPVIFHRAHLRNWMILGAVASVMIVVFCASSTPVMAVFVGFVFACTFYWRHFAPMAKVVLPVGLISLHFLMDKPVWHLMGRMNIVGGSTGWHRYVLFDQFVKHADEWFWAGSDLGTLHWDGYLIDVTNLYVVQGLHGGIVVILTFCAIILFAFFDVGEGLRQENRSDPASRRESIIVWGVAAMLAMHTLNYMAITYFGQTQLMWHFALAAAAACRVGDITQTVAEPRPALPVGLIRPVWEGVRAQ